MGSFRDYDGSGYVLIHGGEIYKFSDDNKSVSEQVNKNLTSGFESPAIFRKDSIYYLLGSDLTSWEKNDNYYYTATSLKGPWILRGNFAQKGTLTWNSQTTFVLPIEGTMETTYMFMGDRWSFPKQASAATYVWQPLIVSGFSLSISNFMEDWQVNTFTGIVSSKVTHGRTIENTDNLIKYKGKWQHSVLPDTVSVSSSDIKDASFSVKFRGRQISLYFLSGTNCGYARIVLYDKKGYALLTSIVDMYCRYSLSTLKFITPVLLKDDYTVTVSVMGERPNWSDKRRSDYGSTGYFVSLDKIMIKE